MELNTHLDIKYNFPCNTTTTILRFHPKYKSPAFLLFLFFR